ncbi:uncharacterized protein LOC130739182 [Lotus japonicus]|uniref:uncharacterized protein LOC130739182 n=1 Tax=Lotus japonicus TaxID=34305 RepID=UPI002585D865|nr:uncharacterized protein LOC130739182 [Lotus japonicus]
MAGNGNNNGFVNQNEEQQRAILSNVHTLIGEAVAHVDIDLGLLNTLIQQAFVRIQQLFVAGHEKGFDLDSRFMTQLSQLSDVLHSVNESYHTAKQDLDQVKASLVMANQRLHGLIRPESP